MEYADLLLFFFLKFLRDLLYRLFHFDVWRKHADLSLSEVLAWS